VIKHIPLLLALVLGLSLCSLTDRFKKSMDSNSSSATTGGSGKAGIEPVERPVPSAAESAALAGGQRADWDGQDMSWTLPPKWSSQSKDKNSAVWGGGTTAFLITNISPMADDFPTDVSMDAYYDGAKTRLKHGELDQLRLLELDGLKGIQWRESKPEKADGIRRLQWMAYRKHAGQVQLVNLILSANGDNFTKHQDELYGILYSTKVAH
jgi:hypothetical protein